MEHESLSGQIVRLKVANTKLTGRIAELEARAEAAEKKFKDEREHSEALQESINKMVDDLEWANGKKAKATKLVARYMPAIKAYANEENWPDGRFDPYRDGRTIAGYEIAQAALSPAAEQADDEGVKPNCKVCNDTFWIVLTGPDTVHAVCPFCNKDGAKGVKG